MGSLAGLDTLRLMAALWVALFHGARLPMDKLAAAGSPLDSVLIAVNNGVFNGVAGVMLFFVISGFVIHRPFLAAPRLEVAPYLARRAIRLVPPAAAVYLACRLAGPSYADALSQVLWSLYCEMAFYLAYPLLRLAFRRGHAVTLYLASSLVAFAVLYLVGAQDYYQQLPILLLILVGAPNWILGCLLAERMAAGPPKATGALTIWTWRLGAVGLSATLKFFVMHGSFRLGYPETHWIFAGYAYFWVAKELGYYSQRPAAAFAEAAGRASYSLYLVHMPIIAAFGFASLAPSTMSAASWCALWLAQAATIALASWLCYVAIERPSHRLARLAGTWLQTPSAAVKLARAPSGASIA